MAFAISGLVLVHGDIEDPMEAVFDAPMAAGDVAEALGGERRAEQVVGGLGGELGTDLTAALDLGDGRESRPGVLFL